MCQHCTHSESADPITKIIESSFTLQKKVASHTQEILSITLWLKDLMFLQIVIARLRYFAGDSFSQLYSKI